MKYIVFVILILCSIQVIVKVFNYYGVYYSLIPMAITIIGSYLFIKKQLK
jgi:hypothetical protein